MAKTSGSMKKYTKDGTVKNALYEDGTARVASVAFGDGSKIVPSTNVNGIALQAKGYVGVVDADTKKYTQMSAKQYRLFVSGGDSEGLLTTSGAGTGAQLALACDHGSCASTIDGSAYNTFRAINIPTSSERYKENIREMTDEEADGILKAVAVAFDWKPDSGFAGPSFSFIAERLAEIDERFIYRNSEGQVDGILANPIMATLQVIVKRHDRELKALKFKNDTLLALLVSKGIMTQEEIDGLEVNV